MGNCLKTQLKETVQNSNLNFLGCIKIHFNGQSLGSLPTNIPTGSGVKYFIIGDSYFTDSTGTNNLGKEISQEGSLNTYIHPGECDIYISNKYNFTSFEARSYDFTIDTNSLNKTPLRSFRTNYVVYSNPDINNIAKTSWSPEINRVQAIGSNIEWEADIFKNFPNIEYYGLTILKGNIENLVNSKNKEVIVSGSEAVGNLSCFLNNGEKISPDLYLITVNNTSIVSTQSTLDILNSKGVTVNIDTANIISE